MAEISIRSAESPEEIGIVRTLFDEYAAWLGFSLCFQGFDQELANLPGKYAPPSGRLVLAWSGSTPAGCGALRSTGPRICEMKRLYIRPEFRGHGLGRKVAEHLIHEAMIIGYSLMRLDTISPGFRLPVPALRDSNGRIKQMFHLTVSNSCLNMIAW